MNRDHLMGWPAALLCVEQESNGGARERIRRAEFHMAAYNKAMQEIPRAWLEFERRKFEPEVPKKEVEKSKYFPAPERELQVGDLVFVTKGNSWIHVGAMCRVEEIDRFYVRLAHSEANTKKCDSFPVSDEAKAMGLTKSWWLMPTNVTFTRE